MLVATSSHHPNTPHTSQPPGGSTPQAHLILPQSLSPNPATQTQISIFFTNPRSVISQRSKHASQRPARRPARARQACRRGHGLAAFRRESPYGRHAAAPQNHQGVHQRHHQASHSATRASRWSEAHLDRDLQRDPGGAEAASRGYSQRRDPVYRTQAGQDRHRQRRHLEPPTPEQAHLRLRSRHFRRAQPSSGCAA